MDKTEIIQAAFKQWQHKMFSNTSLTPVADELKVTKSAIYRHFKGKSSLVSAMETFFREQYSKASPSIMQNLPGKDLSGGLREYSKGLTGFLSSHPGYIRYYTSQLFHRDTVESLPFRTTFLHEAETLLRRFHKSGADEKTALLCVRYFYTHLLGWSLTLLKNGKAEAEIPAFTPVIVTSFLEGFCSEGEPIPDFQAAEEQIVVQSSDLPKDSKIIGSLLKVVAEEGLENATLSRIAEAAGYSKSTLYSFFKNKNEMLFSLFSDHSAAFNQLYLKHCSGGLLFSERIYRLIVLLYRYLIRNRSFLVTLHWMRFQNLHLDEQDAGNWKKHLPLFFNLPDDSACRNFGLNPPTLMSLLWFQLLRQIVEFSCSSILVEEEEADHTEQLRNLYRLFCHGAEDLLSGV